MKPNSYFSIGVASSFVPDMASLSLCYYPIIQGDAFALYHYLVSLSYQAPGRYQLARVLNHLDMGMGRLMKGLDVLSAMDLLLMTQDQEDYLYYLNPPLSVRQFTSKPLYKNLLAKKIGEAAVEALLPEPVKKDKTISKGFSDVFTVEGEITPIRQQVDFDWSAFKALMTKDQLRFAEEQEDVIAITHVAEQAGWNWLETYRYVKETAIGNMVSVKRLVQKQAQAKPLQDKNPFGLTRQEQVIISEAKTKPALTLFSVLKERRQAVVTASERQLIFDLAQLGLLEEVLNILLIYVFNKVDSANLNEKYARKLANDFLYKKIRSAEEAILYLRPVKSEAKKESEKASKTNVPNWSKEEVKTEMTAETKARMDALKQEMLAEEAKGGDR